MDARRIEMSETYLSWPILGTNSYKIRLLTRTFILVSYLISLLAGHVGRSSWYGKRNSPHGIEGDRPAK